MSTSSLRHELHRRPELSGSEVGTAAQIAEFFAALRPDETWTQLGGHGLAFGFGARDLGPTLMLRCELDALPIHEAGELLHCSSSPGISHKCGHDGHMAILAEVGRRLAGKRPVNGRVVLLFQPAEETGAGAAAVIADPRFESLRPDLVFGLHNLPGFVLGEVLLREGTFTCASRGMTIRLQGRPAHAAQPETGLSPARVMCEIIGAFEQLATQLHLGGELILATVVGARLGEAAFGVAPSEAAIFATLRSESDASMQAVIAHCEALVRQSASNAGLEFAFEYQDIFDATINSARAVDCIRAACQGLPVKDIPAPFRWSEDFGRFTQLAEGAFFGLGSGLDHPDLHNANYDFPDALIDHGASIFLRIINRVYGAARFLPDIDGSTE